MGSGTVQFLAATSAGEVLLITAALGWFARRVARSNDRTRDRVSDLVTAVALVNQSAPQVRSLLTDTAEAVTEHTAQIAVLAAWKKDHDRWHERQDVRR